MYKPTFIFCHRLLLSGLVLLSRRQFYTRVWSRLFHIIWFPPTQGAPKPPVSSPPVFRCDYNVYSTFQSHEPEFDYLKSLEIEEKINQISWVKQSGSSLFLLTTNGMSHFIFCNLGVVCGVGGACPSKALLWQLYCMGGLGG